MPIIITHRLIQALVAPIDPGLPFLDRLVYFSARGDKQPP